MFGGHNISQQMLEEMSSDSDVDALPAETIANLVYNMKTTIREKTLRWLQAVADDKGHIPNNPIIAVLKNVTPAKGHRQYAGMSRAERRMARQVDRHLREKIKVTVQSTLG